MTVTFLPSKPRWRHALLPLLLAACCLPATATASASASAGTVAEGAAAARPAKPQAQQVSQIKKRKSRARKARAHRRYAAPPSHGMQMGLRRTPDELALKSSAAVVVDQQTGELLAIKNPDAVLPIASLTKLMTALVVVEAGQSLHDRLVIGPEDVDTHKNTHSRLAVGTELSRDELLLLALMSSENRAAMALSRHYPGGRPAFLAQMNARAKELGMQATHFADAAGLSSGSVSTARDLSQLLAAAYAQPLIRSYSTQFEATVHANGRALTFINSNRLVRQQGDWDIGLQKTGFTNEAGRCLMMQATLLGRNLSMVFLDSTGTLTRYADAVRVRRHLETTLAAMTPSSELVPQAEAARFSSLVR